MHNDKAAPQSHDNIADAIDAKAETSLSQSEVNTSAETEKSEPVAKKPRRKLGSAGAAAG